MGSMRAYEAATIMTDMAGLDRALDYHLTVNHYPPLPSSMIEASKAAIDAMVEEDYEREIPLPDGVRYLDRQTAPAHEIVSAHHLGAFVEARILEEDEEE